MHGLTGIVLPHSVSAGVQNGSLCLKELPELFMAHNSMLVVTLDIGHIIDLSMKSFGFQFLSNIFCILLEAVITPVKIVENCWPE